MYWSYRQIPELAGLSSQDAKRLRRKLIFQMLKRPSGWMPFILLGVFTIGGQVAYSMLMFRVVKSETLAGLPVGFLTGSVPGVLICERLFHRALMPLLRAARPNVCQGCGYDLRGSSERCPECGHAMA